MNKRRVGVGEDERGLVRTDVVSCVRLEYDTLYLKQ